MTMIGVMTDVMCDVTFLLHSSLSHESSQRRGEDEESHEDRADQAYPPRTSSVSFCRRSGLHLPTRSRPSPPRGAEPRPLACPPSSRTPQTRSLANPTTTAGSAPSRSSSPNQNQSLSRPKNLQLGKPSQGRGKSEWFASCRWT